MARCVISRSLESTDDHYARLLAVLGEPVTVCLVHCHYQPCPANGQPANPAPLHTDDHVGRVPAVAEWVTRTARQRPLVIHQGSLACVAPAHETDGVLCWCREDDTVAAGGGEFDVILQGPGGTLYDVHTHVAVTIREPTAVVDLPQDVARPAYEALAVSVLDSVQIRRGGIRYEVDR